MIYKGDTVRLQCHFKTFEGQSVNPDNVTLTIYDLNENQIEQFTDTNNEKLGVFSYDYETASELDEFIFEFAGSLNQKPILSREKVTTKFIGG
ncbi:hypothetical protein ACQ4XT_11410 [Halobacillus faecis]